MKAPAAVRGGFFFAVGRSHAPSCTRPLLRRPLRLRDHLAAGARADTAADADSRLPAPQRSPNALTPVASMPRTIAEPKIRVGLLSDQPAVTFPRTASGYYVVTDAVRRRSRRGFTVRAPLAEAAVRYAVQMAAISDQSSAQALVGEAPHRDGPARRHDLRSRERHVQDPRGRLRELRGGDADARAAHRPRLRQGSARRAASVRPAVREALRASSTTKAIATRVDAATLIDLSRRPRETITIDKQPYRTVGAPLHQSRAACSTSSMS